MLVLLLTLLAPGQDFALNVPKVIQRRTFSVAIDGRTAGTYVQEIFDLGDGAYEVRATSTVAVKVLVVRYNFSYRGQEAWAADLRGRSRLRMIDATTNDDGQHRTCTLRPADPGLKVTGTGGESTAGVKTAWSSTFWCLPATDVRGGKLDLVDLETGLVRPVMLQQTGTANHPVGGACTVWRVSGIPVIELWFDDKGRLARRIMPRKGRTATLDLAGVAEEKFGK